MSKIKIRLLHRLLHNLVAAFLISNRERMKTQFCSLFLEKLLFPPDFIGRDKNPFLACEGFLSQLKKVDVFSRKGENPIQTMLWHTTLGRSAVSSFVNVVGKIALFILKGVLLIHFK